MSQKDFIGPPCDCGACRQANVDALEQVRDPRSGKWLHGYQLKAWYGARDKFREAARAAVGPRGRHASGFEKLAAERVKGQR